MDAVKGPKAAKINLCYPNTFSKIAKKRKRNLMLAWIDYEKAFHSVPYFWIIKS